MSREPRFSLPAEWEPHAAVWTAWPWDAEQWAEGLDGPRRGLAGMIEAIVDLDDGGAPRGERVEVLVRSVDEAGARAALGAAVAGVRFHHAPYGDVWLRDTGPRFLARPGELVAACFRFDGWGGKYVMAGDGEVAAEVAGRAGVPAARFDVVIEGGAIEVDGSGTALASRHSLIGGPRNPGLDADALTARLRWALGVEHVVWLERELANDHTDGHIDLLARFVAPGTVACMEPAADDPNRDTLTGVLADLRAATDARGRGFEIVTVPSPGRVCNRAGTVMPASYMNFYIANTTVVVPTYDVAADVAAVGRIAALFPGRRTVGVPATAVLVGGGAFHCSTQQQPLVVGG